MRLTVRHLTSYAYAPPAQRVALRLRLWPGRFDGQEPVSWRVTVNGRQVQVLTADAWDNQVGLWQGHGAVGAAEILAEGVVETADRAGLVKGLPGRPPERVFLRETPLTEITDSVRDFAAGLPEADPLGWLHALCVAVGEAVVYRPRATDAATSAAAALELGAGVCQDHAHLFIAAARAREIPARYVVGYFLAGEDDVAEVETHGWAEALVPGLGWIGFDPTNAVCPTERYVRLTVGLDSRDAAPVHGSVLGATDVSLSAEVDVAPDASQSQSQSQAQ